MKRIVAFLLILLVCSCASVSVLAEGTVRLVDGAELLTEADRNAVSAKLDEISNRQKFDIVIVTVQALDDRTVVEYADDFFDYGGYGFGENYDGALLLINMEERDWYISTSGYGITALTDAGIDWIGDEITAYLSEDDFYQAFTLFADHCDKFVTQARTGEPYDSGNLPKDPFDFAVNGIIAVAVGLLIAYIVVSSMKGKLESVKLQKAASNYVVPGSLNVTCANDFFLYRHVTRTVRENESSGSSTHTSSSGRTHGGGGGKF